MKQITGKRKHEWRDADNTYLEGMRLHLVQLETAVCGKFWQRWNQWVFLDEAEGMFYQHKSQFWCGFMMKRAEPNSN